MRVHRADTCVRTFWAERRGVASLEFSLIAPVLILCTVAIFQITQIYRAQMRVSSVTDTLGKIVSEQTTVTKSQMQDFCYGAGLGFAPFSAVPYSAAIASVTNRGGVVAMDWEYDVGCGTAATPIGSSAAIGRATANPSQVPVNGNSVLIVIGTYPYQSPLKLFYFLTLQTLVYQSPPIVPRYETAITCSDCGS